MEIIGSSKIQQANSVAVNTVPPMKSVSQEHQVPQSSGRAKETSENEFTSHNGKSTSGSEVKVERMAGALQEYVQSLQRDLNISVHKATGQFMVQVVSKSDGKVIREIPPEEVLNLAARIEEMVGVLFDKNA